MAVARHHSHGGEGNNAKKKDPRVVPLNSPDAAALSLLANLFTGVSAVKAPYAQLQPAAARVVPLQRRRDSVTSSASSPTPSGVSSRTLPAGQGRGGCGQHRPLRSVGDIPYHGAACQDVELGRSRKEEVRITDDSSGCQFVSSNRKHIFHTYELSQINTASHTSIRKHAMADE